MTILQGDIKLVKTQVMQDVPEGGGAPTGIVVVDGASNEIFTDISEADRAGGRVNLRKLAVHIDSPNVDDYLGANIIIAEPPNDPNVSVTLFSTGETFDERTNAVSRISSYLSIGTNYAGYLFGNHITGQDTLQIFQKTNDLPPIGATLVLTKREGYSDEHAQYVRVIEAGAVEVEFEDDKGKYKRWVLSLRLANTLDADFPGFDISRYEYTKAQIALATKLSNTVVANAARYYGVVPLAEAAALGDFTVKAESIFTQLVPSAQIETPIADARTNQVSAGVIATGGTVAHVVTAAFSTTQNLYIGGPVAPGSVSISNAGVTVTDAGGRLMSSGSQVGIIDYENGLLVLTVSVFGSGVVTMSVVYNPAAVPNSVNQSQGFEITAENRSSSYVRTIAPAPVRGTLNVSYMAQGRWYVLREQGDGAIRGSDTAYGAGMLNFTTGTMTLTLGALPDVGSFLIYQWVEPAATREVDLIPLDNGGKLYWPFNTSGVSSTSAGSKAIAPGTLSITWNDGSPRTVTDNGSGLLTGYGTGTVDYAKGMFRLSPTTLPAPGTTVSVAVNAATKTSATATLATGSGNLGATGIKPGSVSLTVTGQLKFQYFAFPIANWGAPAAYRVTDDGAGVLQMHVLDQLLNVGTINYAAGTFLLSATVLPWALARLFTAWDNVYVADNSGLNMFLEAL